MPAIADIRKTIRPLPRSAIAVADFRTDGSIVRGHPSSADSGINGQDISTISGIR